jgi:hypothetical protein
MKRTISSAIFLLLVLLPVIVAQDTSDEHGDAFMLRKDLQAMDHAGYTIGDAYSEAFAFGYVVGVFEALNTVTFCGPGTPRQGQLREVVIKYLNDHPERLNKDRFEVTADALDAAFPCPPPGTPWMVVPRPGVAEKSPVPKKP